MTLNHLIIKQQDKKFTFLPEVEKVLDVSEDEKCQKEDIDLVVKNKDGTLRTIEVKADKLIYKTGNFFFETISNDRKGTLGCFVYSKADDFFYFDVTSNILYVFNLNEARNWFLKNFERFREVATSTPVGNGEYYRTIGRLVGIEEFGRNVKMNVVKL